METVDRVLRLAPVLGITRVANITGLDSIGIPVVMVCRPNSRTLAVSQGKGFTLDAAKASGLMESVEAYHAEHADLELRWCSYDEIRFTESVADVERLPQFSTRLFHSDLRILWTKACDLRTEKQAFVPYELVQLDFTGVVPGTGCFLNSSSGLASGNNRAEAISHALCELVERDAATLWTLGNEGEKVASRLDLSSVNDPDCLELLAKFDAAEMDVGVWDISSDIGIATFRALIHPRHDARIAPPAGGMGCHPDRRIALSRALTEAAQSRLTLIAGSRDDAGRDHYRRVSPETISNVLGSGSGQRRFSAVPTYEAATVEEDIEFELSCLARADLEDVFVVDLTKPGFRIPVVRIIVPGLEPFHRSDGYTPGLRAVHRSCRNAEEQQH